MSVPDCKTHLILEDLLESFRGRGHRLQHLNAIVMGVIHPSSAKSNVVQIAAKPTFIRMDQAGPIAWQASERQTLPDADGGESLTHLPQQTT